MTYLYVWCSNCGRQFHFPDGRNGGFSHCDLHSEFTPLPYNKEVREK